MVHEQLANGRRAIAIEDILRSKMRPVDLLAITRSLVDELPNAISSISVLLLVTLTEVTLQLLMAIAGKNLLESVIVSQSINHILAVSAAVLMLLIVFTTRFRQSMQETIALRWRERCVSRLAINIESASLEDLSAVPMAALREIIMTDAPFLTRFGIETITQFAVLVFWVMAAGIFMLLYAPSLIWVLLGVLLVSALTLAWGMSRHMRLTGERFRRLAALSQSARDVVEVERVLLTRQFGLQGLFRSQFNSAHQRFRDVAERQGKLNATVRALTAVLNSLAFLGFVIVGGTLTLDGQLPVGVLLAALFIMGQMLNALVTMGDLAGRTAEATTAGRRLSVYWNTSGATDTELGNRGVSVPGNKGKTRQNKAVPASGPSTCKNRNTFVSELQAMNIGFGYHPENLIFSQVDLVLKRGQITALTAATGAGKSTLAKVITGLLPVRHGRIQLLLANEAEEGRQLSTLEELSTGSVLYLGPNPILVEGSIKDNLFLDTNASLSNIPAIDTLRAALSHQNIPLDWDSNLVDSAGQGLSSGQAQLVQLARALSRDPDIVVFDEATGSLDLETEHRVQEALVDWCKHRVCLVISHRTCPWLTHADNRMTW